MTINAVRPALPGNSRAEGRAMPALMSACVATVVAMVAAINLAIPKLSASGLRPSSTQLLWIVDTYVLVFGCLLIPAGALGDRYGRKGVLLAGLSAFAAGCLLSAAAPGVGLLLAGRALTGLGAALVMPATLSLLLQVTPPARKPHAIATWTAATGAAGALGNLGGGLVLQYMPWQGLFLVTAPIALALAALVARLAPRGERHPAALDLAGAALLVATVFALLFGIIEGPEKGWTSGLVLGSFGLSAVLLATFAAYAMRAEHPVLDPRVFAVSRLRVGVLGVALAFFGLFALFFVNAQYLQYAKGFSPLVTGLAIGPLAVGMIVVTRRSVGLAARLGARTVVVGGILVLAGGLALMSFMDASTPYALYGITLFVMATGMGLCMPSLSTGIMAALPPARAGMGSGLNSAARELGSALGVAVIGTILAGHFADGLPAALQGHAHSTSAALAASDRLGAAEHAQTVTAFTDAMSLGYRVVAVVLLVAAVVVGTGLRNTKDVP